MDDLNEVADDGLKFVQRSVQVISQAATPGEAVKNLLALLATAVQATSIRICRWDADTHLSTIAACHYSLDASIAESVFEPDLTFAAVMKPQDFPCEGTVCAVQFLRDQQEIISERVASYMRFGGIQSLLLVPVVLHRRHWGHAEIWDTQQERPFTSQQIAWCQHVVQQAVMLQEAERLAKFAEQRRREAAALQQASTYLTGTLNREEVLQRTVDTIRQYLTDIHVCRISLFDPAAQQVRLLVEWRAEDGFNWPAPGTTQSLPDDYASQVALNTQRPFAISDMQVHPFTNDWIRARLLRGIRAVLCLPLIVNRSPIGVLKIFARQTRVFTEEEITICQGVANQAAVAIENARLHRETRQQKEVDRLKSRFVSNVTHELRTPLTNIHTYLSLLERGRPDKQTRYMQVLHEETERLTRLIQDLLDMSQFEMPEERLAVRETDFLRQIQNVLAGYQAIAEKKQIQFTAVLPDVVPPVRISESHLEKVIANLLSNALAYTPENGHVSVTVENQPDHVCCLIADTGPGIPEAELPYIFDRFYRGAIAQETGAPGTGLGLPVARLILERYEGSLTAKNLPGGGACFTFTLPLVAS